MKSRCYNNIFSADTGKLITKRGASLEKRQQKEKAQVIDEPLVKVYIIVGIEQNQEATITQIVASRISSIMSPRGFPYCG